MSEIKQLTINQYEILIQLVTDWYYPFSHFENLRLTRKVLSKEFKILREAGLVQFSNGLMTEDGEVAGSGYGRRFIANGEINKLTEDWEVKNNKDEH